jgi:oligopeptidase B
MQDKAEMEPPIAEKRPVVSSHHGISRTDDYSWLRVDNWREVMRDPTLLQADVRGYLEAENAYTEAMMRDTEALQERLYQEMRGRIKEDDSTVPAPDGPYAYFYSYVTGGQHPRFCRQPGETAADQDAQPEILLDGDAMAQGMPYFEMGKPVQSHDHRLLAYAVDDKGSEFDVTRFKNLVTGETLADEIADTSGSGSWAADNRTYIYTKLDENHRPVSVHRHTLGMPVADDVLLYQEHDPGFFLGAGLTTDRRFLILASRASETTEVRLLNAASLDAPSVKIAERETGHDYRVDHHEGRLIIMTNAAGAEDYKLVEAPLSAPSRENWRDIEPHHYGRLLIAHFCLKDYLVWLERENGLPRIVIRRWADGEQHAIAFAEEAYSLGFGEMYEYDTEVLRFTYSSPTTPRQVFDYNLRTRERVLRKTQEVPSGHDASAYVARRIFAIASDGESIPVTLLYKKDTPLDGTAPCLLYGYGAYGYALPAGFSITALSLVDRGFVYATAHIRGGKDKGFRWYRQGKLENKMNSFTDFITVAQHLADAKFSGAGRIVAHGGSAGGLLMGAVANMAPELFAGIIAEVPFVDTLTTILDDSLPLTPPEWTEWGNPIQSLDAYNTIAAYSPYDNVRRQAYPSMLVTGGLTDPRVTYWEPAKWVAKLRACKTDSNPLMMKIYMEAGHAGQSGRLQRLRDDALAYAFALKVANKTGMG